MKSFLNKLPCAVSENPHGLKPLLEVSIEPLEHLFVHASNVGKAGPAGEVGVLTGPFKLVKFQQRYVKL